MESNLDINVQHVAEKAVVLAISGHLTRLAEKPLDAAYAEAVNLGAKTIILDLSGLTYMNNKGIKLLVRLEARARSGRHRLVAVGLNDHYRHIFQVAGLDEEIAVFADVAQVLTVQR